nr:hypothetical protein [Candidatus Methanoliparum sp. LAM-1]
MNIVDTAAIWFYGYNLSILPSLSTLNTGSSVRNIPGKSLTSQDVKSLTEEIKKEMV